MPGEDMIQLLVRTPGKLNVGDIIRAQGKAVPPRTIRLGQPNPEPAHSTAKPPKTSFGELGVFLASWRLRRALQLVEAIELETNRISSGALNDVDNFCYFSIRNGSRGFHEHSLLNTKLFGHIRPGNHVVAVGVIA